jgi:hypothetical protein
VGVQAENGTTEVRHKGIGFIGYRPSVLRSMLPKPEADCFECLQCFLLSFLISESKFSPGLQLFGSNDCCSDCAFAYRQDQALQEVQEPVPLGKQGQALREYRLFAISGHISHRSLKGTLRTNSMWVHVGAQDSSVSCDAITARHEAHSKVSRDRLTIRG